MKKKSSGCLVFFFKVESGFISESIPPLKVRLLQSLGVETIEDFRALKKSLFGRMKLTYSAAFEEEIHILVDGPPRSYVDK